MGKTLVISAAAGPTGNIYQILVIALCMSFSPNPNIFSTFLPISSKYYTISGAIALDCYNCKIHRKINVKQGSSNHFFFTYAPMKRITAENKTIGQCRVSFTQIIINSHTFVYKKTILVISRALPYYTFHVACNDGDH